MSLVWKACWLILVLGLTSACTTIKLQEQNFLRSRSQVILYQLTRFGDASVEEIAAQTAYTKEQVQSSLHKLQQDQFVQQQGQSWSTTSRYQSEQKEYVESIQDFSLAALNNKSTSHKVKLYSVPEQQVQLAAFTALQPARQTLLIFPGNGFNLVPDSSEIESFLAPDRNVFVMEYPGMGNSKQALTIASLRQAAQQFYQHVIGLASVRDTDILLYGFSLGGFVATELAAEVQPQGLIIDSTAPSMTAWVDANVPLYAKAVVNVEIAPTLKQVSNIEHLKQLTCPVLFIAGADDEITPVRFMREMQQVAQQAKFTDLAVLDGVSHGQSIEHKDFSALVNHFIQQL